MRRSAAPSHDPPETADGTANEFVGADEDGVSVSSDDWNALVTFPAVPVLVSSRAESAAAVVRAAAPTKTAVATADAATSAWVARRTRRWLSSRLLPCIGSPFPSFAPWQQRPLRLASGAPVTLLRRADSQAAARHGRYRRCMDEFTKPITRRASLLKGGGLLAALLAGGAAAEDSDGAGPAGVASGAVTCVLTPELTEGPFYVDDQKLRRNITDGRPGVALALWLAVVNASTCKPIKNAIVDIWHCDALGTYSGVQGNSGTFMRGMQRTNANGVATFRTVYPGWYMGRAVHIHVKVHLGGTVVHTGQLFFSDAVTDTVYKRAPYNRRPGRDMRNSDDSIFVNGGRKSLLTVARSGTGYVGSIRMGVRRS